MMTIKPIPSELSQTEFLNLFGGVFEKSSWIAEIYIYQELRMNIIMQIAFITLWSEYSGHQVMIKSSMFFCTS